MVNVDNLATMSDITAIQRRISEARTKIAANINKYRQIMAKVNLVNQEIANYE